MNESRPPLGSLGPILQAQDLLVAVGPGGVGKTTVSAAMGLEAARMGRNTLVLTIDPAKRLAQALGLTGLDDQVQEVSTHELQGDGVEVGEVSAIAGPYIRFLMIFPGLWFGAMFSPAFSRCGGPTCDLVWYFLVLVTVGTATVCLAAMAIQEGEEDIDINIKPMVSIPEINALFGETIAPTVSPKKG